MAHGQGLDLGNVLQQVETIKGSRLQNQLSQQTFDTNVLAQQGSNQFNALLQQHIANPTEQSLNAIAAVNPQAASQLQGLVSGQQGIEVQQRKFEQQDAERTIKALNEVINSKSPKALVLHGFPDAVKAFEAQGININDLSNEEVVSLAQGIQRQLTPVATAGDDPFTPLSPEGRLAFDRSRGVFGEGDVGLPVEIAEFKNVIENPDGSSVGTNTITGEREIIPRADDAPQTKAQFEAMNKLIETVKKDKRVDNFIQVTSNNDRIVSALDTAAGDISLIFAFMKMLDPGSTVREGEFATAQNSGSVNENIWAAYNKAITGERLVPSRRKDFKNQAEAIFKGSKKTAEKAIAPIRERAKRLGLRSETIDEVVFGLPEEDGALPEGVERVVQDGNIFERQADGSMLFIGKQ